MTYDIALSPNDEVAEESLEAASLNPAASGIKRFLDIGISATSLLLLGPFFLLLALVIRLESRGPALYRQRRTGLGGTTFVILKFRSMRVAEDDRSVVQATRGDCRLTRIGAVLRRTSVDELPQLLNILRGEMSLVGPRPHALVHDEFYGEVVCGYAQRFNAKPGLTGLAQVSGFRGETRRLEDMVGRVDKDLEYIRRWSPMLDLQIMVRTLLLGPFDPAAY